MKTINTVISLFSGAGGMDLGFKGGFEFLGKTYNKLPFEIVWANEINEAACRTYKKNIGDHIVHGDIWSAMDTMPASADVVIGGFPCQDISVNGKGAGIDGKRSGLYRAMVEVISRVRPKIFVAENVKGLLMKHHASALKQVISDFESLGYKVSYKLYHVADYGVPQSRERVIIVGTLPGSKDFIPPEPTYTKENHVTVSKAIADFAEMAENDEINHVWSKAKKSADQGGRKMVADRPGYTIRAECHGNIQYHYSMPRRISMREAARIQSFPDDFIFDAKLRETERQVGNAVPPVFAWHVACSVLDAISCESKEMESDFIPKKSTLCM
ncbi:DNA cytosine methyltransferase [Aeromonas caviae]|uniref:DNA cytosine methyltransferase n=1 Tax=Aeromonas TaxID=642 RepID=UPI002B4A7201|nr:DNA cytosine methyltransferase [Aeromonas caviae]